jgi:outer membrane protein TolC
MSPADAITRAMATRADYRSALELVKAAEFSRQAAIGSLLPTLGLAADIGSVGQQWGSALRTFSVVAAVRIPLFQSGRERSRILAADASLEQERAQLADLTVRIEYEVRAALLDVDAAGQRVKVAQGASDLASLQLAQTQDRFAAGVASHVEVVQAQEAVATASDNLIASQFAHSLAKGALARALGIAEMSVERFLGGQK